MARGSATSLYRIYSSRKNISTVRFSLLNHSFHSTREQKECSNSLKGSVFIDIDYPIHRNLTGWINLQLGLRNKKSRDFNVTHWKSYSTEVNGNDANSILPDSTAVESTTGIGSCSEIVSVGGDDPVKLYRELRDSEENEAKLTTSEWDDVDEIFNCFIKSGWASNQALAIYIGLSFYPTAVRKFQTFFKNECTGDIAKHLISLGPCHESERFLFPIFVEFCLEEFPDEIKRFRGILDSADLTKPHTWFPFARAMKRKIIYHCGPTNSGKTYNALQRFMEAEKGIYCSPLRLLAMEVFGKVNALGVYCSLHTGQEKKHVPFSNHSACTMEMVST
ncbi:DExH-box ATP-dependent RNA helicase DExH18, mitochondrial-like [Papaver somniferum]|uniref:DExH-box ATP-dependent RNA helicase DExH18, mitochondrial-like n=1 Tax=Papaver somniferum TaxID=3469 RepID=UPI000E6FD826|nr:DExH-box ATP-dependent RNA helicase DExH18, mitochondrial-like [Papaver somniferum]